MANNEASNSRRAFLRNAALTGGAMMASAETHAQGTKKPAKKQPNVLMICSDQFRTDFVASNGRNPSVKTPNIDALAARGASFQTCVCNQPLCSPSRSSFMSSNHGTRTGVWKLNLEPDHSLPSVATVLKQQGYTTAFIGKWHQSGVQQPDGSKRLGWIEPGPSRWGFDDHWEGANNVDSVTHPYQGNYYDNDGRNIGFRDIYRVDFITQRAEQFLENTAKNNPDKPWLLYVSQLEPHQQNDVDDMVPPKRYEGKYDNAYVPTDLRDLPGNWNSRLKGYYGCVEAIDDCVGSLMKTLEKTGQLDNTIVVFFSDHGCTFRTRMGEYKRSPHDAAIRVPLIFAGPGFDKGTRPTELVSLLDLAPTLIDASGHTVPAAMKGRSLAPHNDGAASHDKPAQQPEELVYIQISDSMVARAIRTRDWLFCAYDPDLIGDKDEYGKRYLDFCMYQVNADPDQRTNLVGRAEYKDKADELRELLHKQIIANGEPEPVMVRQKYYV